MRDSSSEQYAFMAKLMKPLILLGIGFAAALFLLVVMGIGLFAFRGGSDIAVGQEIQYPTSIDEARADRAREEVVAPPQIIPIPVQPEQTFSGAWVLLGAVAIICFAAYHMLRLYLQYKRERDDVMFP